MSGDSEFWIADQRFDLAAYVKQQGGVPGVHGRSTEFVLRCPDCDRDKLAVNIKKRAWRCFHCGDAGRDAISLLVKAERMMWRDALVAILSGSQTAIGRIDQLESFVAEKTGRPPGWVPSAVAWPDTFEPLSPHTRGGQQGIWYCHKRGITPVAWEGMRLGVCTAGRQTHRLVFPARDHADRLLFYQGRAMWDPQPGSHYIKTLGRKIVEPEREAGSGDTLLNLDVVRKFSCQRVLVVEGPVDCAHAYPDAVAIWGKKISGYQVELLMRAGVREIDLGLDGEAIADMQAQAPLLADLFRVRIVRWPPGKDPGDLTKAEIEHYRAQAVQWGTGERLDRVSFSLR